MFRSKNISLYPILCSLFVGTALLLAFHKQIAGRALQDVSLSIFFVSAPKGQFQASPSGQKALRAIHILIQRTRKERESEGGGLIFLQGGQLSQARNARELKRTLIRPGFHLASYLDYDGLALPNKELQLLEEILSEKSLKQRLQRLPLLGFNVRNLNRKLPLSPYKIATIQGHSIFLSALIAGPEPDLDSNPWKRLTKEFQRQSGAELSILLLDGMVAGDPHGNPNDTSQEESYMDPHLPQAFSTRKLLASKAFFDFFRAHNPAKPVSLPANHENRFAHKTFLFISGNHPNRFYRHLAGPYICKTQSGDICRLDLRIRNRTIIQLKQRFLSVRSLLGHIQEEGRTIPYDKSSSR